MRLRMTRARAILLSLRIKGESEAELRGFERAMQARTAEATRNGLTPMSMRRVASGMPTAPVPRSWPS